MRTVLKIFGDHDFEVHQPEVDKLPEFQKSTWRFVLDRSALVGELSQARDLAAAELALRRYVERAERAVLSVGRGLYAVKAGKGKSELSRRIAIACARGHEPSAPTVTSSFYAPASLVVLAPLGARGHQEAFLPAFLVREKLKEVARRAAFKRQQFERVPLTQPCWPRHLKQQFLDSLLLQLPSADTVEQARRTRDRERASIAEQAATAARGVVQQRAEVALLLQKQKHQAALDRARRNAKMPMRTNVNVRWTAWIQLHGRLASREHSAQNVSVRVAGAASYIIFADGREVRVATKNLEYL